MSSSMHQSIVDRLRREIAELQRKAAAERSQASRDRDQAMRARNSVHGSMGPSLVAMKLREAQRYEAGAGTHDRRAVDHDRDAARKTRDLAAAESARDKALVQERRRQDDERRRHRDEELRRIRQLEETRRETQAESDWPDQPHVVVQTPVRREPGDYEFDVCLSFAGEERTYVEMVAAGLKARGLRVFYDQDEQVKLWGKDLVEHFEYVYRTASRYCVMFVSAAYAAKPWTRLERRSALARALVEQGEYILPARFDDTELAGLLPTVAYLDLREIAAATLVEHIADKLGADKPEERV